MEEKWWSKFQTKSADGNPSQEDYLSVDDIKEVVAEELQETFEDVVEAGKKTSAEFVHWANDKLEEQPELKEAFTSTKSKLQEGIDWASDVWNQPKVQQSVDMVSKKTNEVLEGGAKVVDDIKHWTTSQLEKPEVVDTFEAMKESAEEVMESSAKVVEDVKHWSQETWNRPEVQETVASAKEVAAEAVSAGKHVVKETVEWATELKNRPEVKETMQSVRWKSSQVASEVKEGIDRVVHDPKVKKNVDALKTNVNDFTFKTSEGMKRGYDNLKGSTIRDELKEFKDVAVKLGRQSARVVVTTVEEIRTNETVIATVEKGKEISLDLLDRGIDAIRNFMERREERKMRQRMYEQEWEFDARRTHPAKPVYEDFEDELDETFDESMEDSSFDEGVEDIERESSSKKVWDFDDMHEEQ